MKWSPRSWSRCSAGVAVFLAWTGLARIAVAAVPIGNSDVQVGGFISQGWLYASDNNYPTADKGGTFEFREMAFNVSTTLGSRFRIGAQAFAQRLGELGRDKVLLDWAVADYNFNPAFGLRAGRVKYPKGLYGEALDLDMLRPFVFLPGAVYSPVLRNFHASFDGGMGYGTLSLGGSSFDYQVFYGDIPMPADGGAAEFYNSAGNYSKSGPNAMGMDSVVGGQLAWNPPVKGLKAVYSYSKFKNMFTDGPLVVAPQLNLHSNFKTVEWHTFSAEYQHQEWTFAAEFQRCWGAIVYTAPPVLPGRSYYVGWDGWYVSGARRLAGRFEVGAYYGHLQNRFPLPGTPDREKYQRDLAASVRCDINDHLLLKLEVHRLEGLYQTFNTLRIPNPPAGRQTGNTLVAVKTTLSF